MQLNFAKNIGFYIWKTDIKVYNINSFRLEIFDMIIAIFQIVDKMEGSCNFIKIFLLVDISISVALIISFFTLNNVEINFGDQELNLKLYITIMVLLTGKQIERIMGKKFAVANLDLKNETFVVYIIFFISFNLEV